MNGDFMIGYPTKKKNVNNTIKISTENRGMDLERELNITNQYYLDTDQAVVHKKPTPVQVVSVDYPKRSAVKITEAYYKLASTTDYNGVYKGLAIDFEAKQTRSKNSFPFSIIHLHQVEHMKKVIKHGGIAFVIIQFQYYNETYYVEAEKLIRLYYGERRSIPYSWFKEEAHLIPYSLTPPIHYLKVIDALYLKEYENEKNKD